MWQVIGKVGRWVLSVLVVTLMSACSESASSLSSSPSKQVNEAKPLAASIAVNASNSLKPAVPTFKAAQQVAGFSPDGRYYVYLESSRDTGAGIPKLNLQVVDVSANACISDGCIETQYGEKDAELSIRDAEKELLKQTWKLRQELQLTSPTAGTRLPILARSRSADGTETVMVQLNDRNQPLQLRLQQKRITSAITGEPVEKDQAAMQLQVFDGREPRSLDSLTNFRDWVLDYSIREVYLSPNGNRVVVLLTATKPTFEGTIGTTLIQSFEL